MKLNAGAITQTDRTRWAPRPLHGFWFDVGTPAPVSRVITPSSTGEVTINDRVYRRDVGDVTVTDYSWPYTIAPERPGPAETIARTTSNAAVIIPDSSDVSRWLWQGNGTATITLTSSGGTRTVSATVTCSTGGGATVDTFLRYVTGSLRRALTDAIDLRLVGKTAATALPVFSTQNHSAPSYVRNASGWAADVDLTPISPWNSAAGQFWAGILISPRHVLCATHAPLTVGASMRWIKSDGTIATRTLSALSPLPGYVPYYPDLSVGVLDSDVPSGIAFARVLPDAYAAKLPGSLAGLPVLVTDQEEKAVVTDLASISAASGYEGAMVALAIPSDATRLTFYEEKIGGDSGNPVCLVLGTQLIVLTVLTFGGPGSGTDVRYHRAAINALMTTLGGGYQLTDADLSGYPSY